MDGVFVIKHAARLTLTELLLCELELCSTSQLPVLMPASLPSPTRTLLPLLARH